MNIQRENMDFERFERWNIGSRHVKRIGDDIQSIILMLGRLDSQLISIDKELKKIIPQDPSDPKAIQIAIDLGEHLTLSYLWVLGTFEIVRTLDFRCRKDPTIFSDEINRKIKYLKQYFNRLRVPLAKLEPEEHHTSTDFSIAFPAIGKEGIGWRISSDTIIYRRRLSNKLLELLEEISE